MTTFSGDVRFSTRSRCRLDREGTRRQTFDYSFLVVWRSLFSRKSVLFDRRNVRRASKFKEGFQTTWKWFVAISSRIWIRGDVFPLGNYRNARLDRRATYLSKRKNAEPCQSVLQLRLDLPLKNSFQPIYFSMYKRRSFVIFLAFNDRDYRLIIGIAFLK